MNTFTDIEGARSHFPEDTIEAFDAALDGGANALETDVHLTRDGQVVVFHDATGHRIAGVHAAIASVDLQHALNWDVGFQFETAHGTRPFQNAGFRPESRAGRPCSSLTFETQRMSTCGLGQIWTRVGAELEPS